MDSSRRTARTASGPANSRAYAIGDVHGRLDLMQDLLGQITRDNESRGPAKTYLIMLGDLVDRGPASCGVVDLLLRDPAPFARTVFIKGNHEEFFLNVLKGDDDSIPHWLTYGGYECAESYGLSRGFMLNATPHEIGDRLRDMVPRAHFDFLDNMGDSFKFGDYFFVHAGIRPGVPIAEQTSRDLRWIREGFLDDRTDHGIIVVHGHTIVDRPEQHPNRIALDTGAYKSGLLTAIGLQDQDRWFISTGEALQSAAA